MFEKCVRWIRNALGVVLLGTVLVAPATAHAQPYPNRPIKIIVPYAAGGAVDIVARSIGQPLAEALKQPVIVDNRPGASANIGMEMVAKATPDGYTLLMASNGIATNMALFPNLTFDGRRDFVPIAKIGYAPLVIVAPASSPAKSLKDLIAMAKAESIAAKESLLVCSAMQSTSLCQQRLAELSPKRKNGLFCIRKPRPRMTSSNDCCLKPRTTMPKTGASRDFSHATATASFRRHRKRKIRDDKSQRDDWRKARLRKSA